MAEPFLTFLTDFGDTAPATCRGVIWSILPGARINDLTHGTRPFGIREAAFLLWSSLPYQPVGVHLAVVDPGVGTSRRGIAIEVARGDRLVGPDNGLLLPAAERLGGVGAAHVLDNRALWRASVSHTFHGRDIFAPVAAHLAAGTPIAETGPAIDPGDLVALAFPQPAVRDGALETSVLFVDSFGNVRLGGRPADLEAAIGPLTLGRELVLEFPAFGEAAATVERTIWERTFGRVPVGASLLMSDSEGHLSLADNQGDAAKRLGLTLDRPVIIGPA